MIGTNNKKAFTLIELVIAVAIFVVIMLGVTRIFQFVIEGQRSALASYQVQESLKYFFEVMSKEVRMAKSEALDCYVGATSGKIYATDASQEELYFKNYNDQCVAYYVDNNRFVIARGAESGYITPANISIESVRFVLEDEMSDYPASGEVQPSVTVNLDVKYSGFNKSNYESEMMLQTTIASRHYE